MPSFTELALKGAFSRTEESIRSTAVVAASATGKTVSKLLNILVSEEPHLLAKIGFKGFTMNSLVRNVAGLRAGFDEETGVAPAGEDAKSASEIDTTVSSPAVQIFRSIEISTDLVMPLYRNGSGERFVEPVLAKNDRLVRNSAVEML